jgi:hypothetical protein
LDLEGQCLYYLFHHRLDELVMLLVSRRYFAAFVGDVWMTLEVKLMILELYVEDVFP